MGTKTQSMTLTEVKRRIKGIVGEKRRTLVCALIGHSKIVTMCFGYVSCARCEAQIGDRIGGVFDLADYVLVGHNCKECRKNFKKLDWHDTFLAPDPFKKDEVAT